MAQVPLGDGKKPRYSGFTQTLDEGKAHPTSSLGSDLLREYRTHLDPLNTSDGSNMDREDTGKPVSGLPDTSASPNDSIRDVRTLERPLVSPSRSLVGAHLSHNGNGTHGLPPHRSMLKALASRSSNENLRQHKNTSHPSLSDLTNPMTSFAARFTHSPCFFHKRFDDAVNVDRVLEEIAAEEDGMSHSTSHADCNFSQGNFQATSKAPYQTSCSHCDDCDQSPRQ